MTLSSNLGSMSSLFKVLAIFWDILCHLCFHSSFFFECWISSCHSQKATTSTCSQLAQYQNLSASLGSLLLGVKEHPCIFWCKHVQLLLVDMLMWILYLLSSNDEPHLLDSSPSFRTVRFDQSLCHSWGTFFCENVQLLYVSMLLWSRVCYAKGGPHPHVHTS